MMHLNAFKRASLMLLTLNCSCFFLSCEGAIALPPTGMGTVNSFDISVAADNSNNAVAVYTDNGQIQSRYSPGNLTWEPAVLISDPLSSHFSPHVAMDATSTALSVWIFNNGITTNAGANQLIGGVWGSPVILEASTLNAIQYAADVSMNGSGGGVAAWAETTLNETHASFYTAGAWAPFQVIGTPTGTDVNTAYSANGNAAVVWTDSTNDVYAATSIGLVWQTQTNIGTTNDPTIPADIGMDANGNAIALWASPGGLDWSRFNGTTWSAPQTIPAQVIGYFNIAVAPNGNAVAVWSNFNAGSTVQYSQFDGTTWNTPTIVDEGFRSTVAMDSNGNALIEWSSTINQDAVYTALLPLGGTVGSRVTATSGGALVARLAVALSSGSIGVSAWFASPDNTFATFIVFDPAPPTGITGRVCSNTFASQTDRVHIINWSPSTDPTTVAYYIYRNGVLINIVPATGPFTFYDHNRTKGSPDTYVIVAVNAQGVQSSPVSITLN